MDCPVCSKNNTEFSFIKNGYPTVHGWVYDMKTGKLNDMNIDFEKKLRKVQLVYKIE